MTSKSYRGTYVIERKNEDGSYELLFSVSDELASPSADAVFDPLLLSVSTKIEKFRSMIGDADEDPTDLPIEVVPNSPTIRSVEIQKED